MRSMEPTQDQSGLVQEITLRVHDNVLRCAEHDLGTPREELSALFERLVMQAVRRAPNEAARQQWTEEYARHPQTEEEFGWVDAATQDHLAHLE